MMQVRPKEMITAVFEKFEKVRREEIEIGLLSLVSGTSSPLSANVWGQIYGLSSHYLRDKTPTPSSVRGKGKVKLSIFVDNYHQIGNCRQRQSTSLGKTVALPLRNLLTKSRRVMEKSTSHTNTPAHRHVSLLVLSQVWTHTNPQTSLHPILSWYSSMNSVWSFSLFPFTGKNVWRNADGKK